MILYKFYIKKSIVQHFFGWIELAASLGLVCIKTCRGSCFVFMFWTWAVTHSSLELIVDLQESIFNEILSACWFSVIPIQYLLLNLIHAGKCLHFESFRVRPLFSYLFGIVKCHRLRVTSYCYTLFCLYLSI